MPKLAQLYQLYQELSDNLPKKSQKLLKLIIAINPSLQQLYMISQLQVELQRNFTLNKAKLTKV